jgi:hypothetical protein
MGHQRTINLGYVFLSSYRQLFPLNGIDTANLCRASAVIPVDYFCMLFWRHSHGFYLLPGCCSPTLHFFITSVTIFKTINSVSERVLVENWVIILLLHTIHSSAALP